MQLLIQYHLAQLQLHLLPPQPSHALSAPTRCLYRSTRTVPTLKELRRNVRDLDDGVGLDDAQEVLLEEGVVEGGEVRADGYVGGELCSLQRRVSLRLGKV